MSMRVLVIGVALLIAGCAPDVEDLREAGIVRYRSQQNIESMSYLRDALRNRPNDAQSNYYMGLNYRQLAERQFQRGNAAAAKKMLDKALYYYTQSIKTWPNYMEAIAARNEALESRGKYEEALASAADTARINRGTSEKHFIFLGNEYRDRGDFDNALRNYKIALSMNPDSSLAYAEMGRMYLLAGDRDLAIDSLEHAYMLNPSEAGVVDQLADLSSDTLEPAGAESPQHASFQAEPPPAPPRAP